MIAPAKASPTIPAIGLRPRHKRQVSGQLSHPVGRLFPPSLVKKAKSRNRVSPPSQLAASFIGKIEVE
jgi:hypothetical protein